MAMDIIYKYETKFDDHHKFSIDLSSNNEIQNMVFKECDNSEIVYEIHAKLRNFTSFDHGILTCLTLPDNKTYE